jgi:hypothetical protein
MEAAATIPMLPLATEHQDCILAVSNPTLLLAKESKGATIVDSDHLSCSQTISGELVLLKTKDSQIAITL